MTLDSRIIQFCLRFPFLANAYFRLRPKLIRLANRLKRPARVTGWSAAATLYIASTNVCNARCTFCAYPKLKLDYSTMPMETAQRLMLEWSRAGGHAVDFIVAVGEPTLDANLVEKIEFARDLGMTSIGFTTNGTRLSVKDNARRFLNAGITRIGVSIGDTDREGYRQSFGVDAYARVIQGVESLLINNRAMGNPCRVGLHFRTVKDPATVIRSEDFQNRLMPYIDGETVSCYFASVYDSWGGKVGPSDMKGWMRMDAPLPKRGVCKWMLNPTVLSDGTVRACPCRILEDQADELVLGHVARNTLESCRGVLAGIIERFERGDLPAVCRQCTVYQPA